MDGESLLTSESARRVLLALLLFECLLLAAYVGDHLLGSSVWLVHRLVDLDGEQSVATWFSSLQLFMVALLVLLKAAQPGPLAPRGRRFLLIVGVGFVFLSADEALSIHEAITRGLHSVAWAPRFQGGFGTWIPLYLAFIIAFALGVWARLKFLWLEFAGPTAWLFGGFGLFIGGAVGIELIGYGLAAEAGPTTVMIQVALEEGCEMVGISFVLYGAARLALAEGPQAHPWARSAHLEFHH